MTEDTNREGFVLFINVDITYGNSGFCFSGRARNSRHSKPSSASHRSLEGKVFDRGAGKELDTSFSGQGVASFLLLDTGPDDKPVADPQPAAWSQLTNDRVSFSGEAELPIGTCCREIGTLIFKGKFTSSNSISGKLIFVTSIDEDESPNKLRSVVGTFTATRLLN